MSADKRARLRELEKRLESEPENLGLRVTIAGALRETGRGDEAVELYRSVAIAYREQGRTQQAIAVCKSILEVAPDDARCHALLAALVAAPPPPSLVDADDVEPLPPEPEAPRTATPPFGRPGGVLTPKPGPPPVATPDPVAAATPLAVPPRSAAPMPKPLTVPPKPLTVPPPPTSKLMPAAGATPKPLTVPPPSATSKPAVGATPTPPQPMPAAGVTPTPRPGAVVTPRPLTVPPPTSTPLAVSSSVATPPKPIPSLDRDVASVPSLSRGTVPPGATPPIGSQTPRIGTAPPGKARREPSPASTLVGRPEPEPDPGSTLLGISPAPSRRPGATGPQPTARAARAASPTGPQAPARRSSFDETPLPRPLPYHVADPTTSQAQKVSAPELPAAEGVDTRPGDEPRTQPEVSGIAAAARRISQSLITGIELADDDDVAAELETRQRPRIDTGELDKIAVPPPTVPTERVELAAGDSEEIIVLREQLPAESGEEIIVIVPTRSEGEDEMTDPRDEPQVPAAPPTPSEAAYDTAFFAPLADKQRPGVLRRFVRRSVRAGYAVIRQGDTNHPFVVVLKGRLNVVSERPDGTIVALGKIGEGEFVGEASLLARLPAQAQVIAASDAELLVMLPRDLYDIIATFPSLWAALKEVAERRTREQDAKLRR